MNHETYTTGYLRGILKSVHTIAMVGASANPVRASFIVMKYLQRKGFRIIPVNPGLEGQILLGEKTYAALADIPDRVDMVDIFRNAAAAGPLTDDAIRIGAKVVWMQLGVVNADAARRAEQAGLKVVMNRCPKIEFSRLSGEGGWAGINSGIISNRRSPLIQNRGNK